MLDRFERVEDINERKILHCANCKRATIHNLESQCKGYWGNANAVENGGYRYSIFRCGACDSIAYETTSWVVSDLICNVDDDLDPIEHSMQYPAPVSAHFNFNTDYTPSKLDKILDEMLYALAGSKTILATIGLRLAVEYIVNDNKSSGKNLQQKIDNLYVQNIIDDDQRELLHRIREYGNAGAHEAIGMNANELVAGMGIIDGLLEKLYNGPGRHKDVIQKAQRLLKSNSKKGK